MAKREPKTTVLPDGLRYKTKIGGSPFKVGPNFASATMSCFLCGKHRSRAEMMSRKLLGRSQAVCAPSCKVMDEGVR